MSEKAPAIQVQLLSGPNSGQRLRFTRGPLRFGRDPDADIVLAEPFVSREHGELHLTEGVWSLVSLSANGARVSGSNVRPGSKPRPLTHGDVVAIGNQPVFGVQLLDPGTPAAAGQTETAPQGQPAPKSRNKNRLWIGIGVYMLLMLGLLAFGLTLGDSPTQSRPRLARQLSAQEIAADIERRLPPMQPPNPARADMLLREANEWYFQIDTRSEALFRAHQAYKQSLAAAGRQSFERGLDQQRFFEVQDRLVDQVTQQYNLAYNQLASGNAVAAAAEFRRLLDFYTDRNSQIYANAIEQFRAADAMQQQRRRR